MFADNQPCDPKIHELSVRLARECRRIIEGCVRKDDWNEVDLRFYRIVRSGLEEYKGNGH